METPAAYQGPALVELMGHRKSAGLVSEVIQYGSQMLRIDTPDPSGAIVATQFYGGAAIYCLTPCDEATMQTVLSERSWDLPDPVRLSLCASDNAKNRLIESSGTEPLHDEDPYLP